MIDKRLSILIISSEFPPLPGGIGNHAHQLALHLSRLGHYITVLSDYRTYTQEEEKHFDSKQPYDIQRISRKKNRIRMYLERIRRYRQLVSDRDVIIASGKFSLWLVGFGTRGFSHIPKIAILHGTEVNFQKKWLKWSVNNALKQFDKAVAVSRFTASLVKQLPLEVKIIPNGINLEDWQKHPHKEKKEEVFPVLITVGNLTERKGQANVIKKLPVLLNDYPKIKYDCVGLPTEVETLEKLVQELGVKKQVQFCGKLSDQELKDKLSQSDIFVMLSQQTTSGDVEGFGIAILEANAMGVPAIGALGAGIEEAIADGQSGVLVNATDSEGFKKALETILSNKNQFQQGALKWAQAHDWKVIVKLYLEVIEGLF